MLILGIKKIAKWKTELECPQVEIDRTTIDMGFRDFQVNNRKYPQILLKLNNKSMTRLRCEEDREVALKTLDGYKWKGRALSVKVS